MYMWGMEVRIDTINKASMFKKMFEVLVKLEFIQGIYVDEDEALEDWGITGSGSGWIITIINNDNIGKYVSKSKSYRS